MMAGLVSMAQEIPVMHTPFADDGWLSCQKSSSPNPDRPRSHWLLFDLGFEYVLDSTYIYNYNAWGADGAGAREVVIDLSLDGADWTEAGEFDFPKAPGSYKYEGFEGPNLGGMKARYVLVTVLNAWDSGACAGLGEMRFNLSDQTTSAHDTELAGVDVRITPNPVTELADAWVSGPEEMRSVKITDVTGKIVYSQRSDNGSHSQLSFASYPPGMYLVQFIFDKGVITRKVVVAN